MQRLDVRNEVSVAFIPFKASIFAWLLNAWKPAETPIITAIMMIASGTATIVTATAALVATSVGPAAQFCSAAVAGGA